MYSVIAYDGQVYGPVDVRTLIAWCQQGRIVASTHLVETQTGRSFLASDMPDLHAALAQSQIPTPQAYPNPSAQTTQFYNPQQPQGTYNQAPYDPQQFPSQYLSPQHLYAGPAKSKSTALWLCFLLGFLGAHRFYLGHTVSAIAMLVVGLLAFGSCPFFIVSAIWCTVDFFRIMNGSMGDAQGVVPR